MGSRDLGEHSLLPIHLHGNAAPPYSKTDVSIRFLWSHYSHPVNLSFVRKTGVFFQDFNS